MEMTLRWYGSKNDSVTLKQIRQIPGVVGVISALHDIPVGIAWTYEEVKALKDEVEAAGLKLVGIESINVHEDIKLGDPKTRDMYIENYCKSLEAVGKNGIHLVCYNFMPIFDWTRTDLAMPLPDGSNALAYDENVIGNIDPNDMFERMECSEAHRSVRQAGRTRASVRQCARCDLCGRKHSRDPAGLVSRCAGR